MNLEGRCACGAITYQLTGQPLIVNACHCRDCQRLTGSAFAVNLWMERKAVEAHGPEPKTFRLAGGSGRPHDVFYCGECGTYLWSRYHGAPGDFVFVRAGTLDNPGAVKPDVHIFTRTKVPWLELPEGVPSFKEFYRLAEVWSDEALARIGRSRRT